MESAKEKKEKIHKFEEPEPASMCIQISHLQHTLDVDKRQSTHEQDQHVKM